MIQDLASIWQNQFLETLISLHSLERDFMKKFAIIRNLRIPFKNGEKDLLLKAITCSCRKSGREQSEAESSFQAFYGYSKIYIN